MAASDRLKALDAKIRADEYAMGALSVYAPWLLDALPQIVAEVKAATVLSNFLENERETFEPPSDLLDSGFVALETSADYELLEQLGDVLVAALAALDEALSSPTGGSP